jgi:hypothetical protein
LEKIFFVYCKELNYQCGDAIGGVFSSTGALHVSEPHMPGPVPVPIHQQIAKFYIA